MTPDERLILTARRDALTLKLAKGGGRSTQALEADIALLKDRLAPAPAPELLPPPARSLTLEPGAPLPRKLRDFYKLPHKGYIAIYQLSPKHGDRTIKRWVQIGRYATPPEPPPLDDPPAMAAWWRRHSTERPPPVLLDYESAAPTPPMPVHEAPPAPMGPQNASEKGASRAAEAPASDPVTLSGIDPGSERSVLRAAEVETVYHELHVKALQAGKLDEARKWRGEYEGAAELTNKLRRQDREERKAIGELISRGPVIAELSQLLEALRLMREAMPQKITAELSKRADGRVRRVLKLIEPSLVEAILAVRAREADILTTIELLRSPAAARTAFALEAA